MSLLRTLIYFFQEALLDLRRNKALYGFAWFVVALSLFVLGFSRYIAGNVNGLPALKRPWGLEASCSMNSCSFPSATSYSQISVPRLR